MIAAALVTLALAGDIDPGVNVEVCRGHYKALVALETVPKKDAPLVARAMLLDPTTRAYVPRAVRLRQLDVPSDLLKRDCGL